jgi:hypothetical protein
MPPLLWALLRNSNVFLVVLAYTMHIPDEHTAVPKASTCRIFTGALSQQECGSCAAFATSTLSAMRACLRRQEDVIPSPFRVFDCTNATCDSGLDVARAAAVIDFGVGDIDASPHRYGLPCDLRWEARPPEPLRVKHRYIDGAWEIKASILFAGPVLGSILQPLFREEKTGVYITLVNPSPFLAQLSKKRHAIVVVGWDRDGNWIIQNSWGEEWGDGYGRGRIAPDVLAYAIDPTVHIAVCIYMVVLVVLTGLFILLWTYEKWERAPPAPT